MDGLGQLLLTRVCFSARCLARISVNWLQALVSVLLIMICGQIELTATPTVTLVFTQSGGFDGQLTDRHTRWQFLGQGYRAYNPVLRRFMAADPMSPFGQGGLNSYIFGDNNPIMTFDPTGHFSVSSLL